MRAAGGRFSLCEVKWRMSVGSQKGPELLSVGAYKHGSFRIQLRDGESCPPVFSPKLKKIGFPSSSLRFFHMSFLAFLKEECHKENIQICPDVIKYFPKKAKLFLSITLVCRLP